jgi:hypothetical protein
VVSLITAFSAFRGSVFASWDKLGLTSSADTSFRLSYNTQQRSHSVGLMTTADTNVDEGLRAVLADKTLSPEAKMETVLVAEKLKGIVQTQREKVAKAYDDIDVSIKSKEPAKTDMSQHDLKQVLLELQQQFDRELQKDKLKDTIPATWFGNKFPDVKREPAEMAT